ncbi:beta-lactamase [Purpureocillium lavendulum]|uniref:Beta-lactamase n=1 Tax=Purpureocillium lavendulum TaxID=1247861 RepID=A0AB34FSU5_9HYPO|nr:beta-lactamase [Purpureocillium lavendulum]
MSAQRLAMSDSSLLIARITALVGFVAVSSAGSCPPLGPVLPAPQSPSSSTHLRQSIAKLTSLLDTTLAARYNTSGIAIAVQSIHEDAPLFSYFRTPRGKASGYGTTRDIDMDTVFRVGSVSKLVTALAAMQQSRGHGLPGKIDLDASVLEYIPELANSTAAGVVKTRWQDVTVRALASHLSGLADDKFGLPPITNGTGPPCAAIPGASRLCTKADLVRDLNRRPPVYRPYAATPSYSNTGFALLGMVIEAAAGRPFKEVVQKHIFAPAGMNGSSFDGPVQSFDTVGFVPPMEPTWNATLGVYEPAFSAGGMFSSTRDLVQLGRSILSHRLLPESITRSWMHPLAHTSSPGQSVGAPWEILRTDNLTAARHGRVIDVYTKTGDLGLYHAHLALLPDYGLVASVIVAGAEVSADPLARTKLLSQTLRGLIPAVERAGRDEAREKYVGRYVDATTNSTLSVTMDGDDSDAGSGLFLAGFSARGFDVLDNIHKYNPTAGAGSTASTSSSPSPKVIARLYPTDVTSQSGSRCGNGTSTGTAWRAIVDSTTAAQREEQDTQLFYMDGSCEAWFGVDGPAYNYLTLTEFVFLTDEDGGVTGVRNLAFNVTMGKVKA